MPKFAPKNDEGLAPYVLSIWRFGRVFDKIVHAENATIARQSAGRMGTAEYVDGVRRATPADIETIGD